MGTDALGYTLALLTLGMTLLAFKFRLALVTLGTVGLWVALLAYFVTNLSATPMLQQIILAIAAFVGALFFFSMFGKMPGEEGESSFRRLIRRMNGETVSSPRKETPEDYRETLHRALHPNRMRRR